MEENLLIGDHLLVNKMVYSPSLGAFEDKLLPKKPIERGDVIVFKYPDDPTRDFIKRVIGLPGETLELRNKVVYVNGKPLDEPYVHFLEPPLSPTTRSTVTAATSASTGAPRSCPKATSSSSATTATTAGTAGTGASCPSTS